MRFEIRGRPEFAFKLTREQVTLLMACSAVHYDAVCRAASDPRCADHFVYKWSACMTNGGKDYDHRATWRELDTALKILEYPSPSATAKQRKLQLDLRQAFWDAMSAAEVAMKQWHLVHGKEAA